MANGSPFALNFVFLLILLFPGYACLRGYRDATFRLETRSRIEKLMIIGGGGLVTLALTLVADRFGLFDAAVVVVRSYVDAGVTAPDGRFEPFLFGVTDLPLGIGAYRLYVTVFRALPAVAAELGWSGGTKLTELSEFTGLSLVTGVIVQSAVGYGFGYLGGTVRHVVGPARRSTIDAEQPWKVLTEYVAASDRLVVTTTDGRRIRGKLLRIGSPSEKHDVLLQRAVRTDGPDGKERLGIVYIDQEDVLRIVPVDVSRIPERGRANRLVWLYRTITGSDSKET